MLQYARLKALAEPVLGGAHPSDAQQDEPLATSRRRAFRATHLALGALPFAALPPLLASGNVPSGLGLAAFALLAGPLIAAIDLGRSGSLGRAQLTATACFAALAALVAGATGGAASPALALAALPVIDAALSGLRGRTLGAVAAVAVGAPLAVALACAAGLAPPLRFEPALGVATMGAAAVYATALAIRAAAAAAAADRAYLPDAARFEAFASSLDDLVTRHAANGAVTFASPAARALLDAPARDLLDQGLLARVHIADRPAYLQALSRAAESEGWSRSELRIRRGVGSGAPVFAWTEMRVRAARAHEADAASLAAAPVVATFRDLGPAKAHEEALIAARDEADRANVAKTRFLALMSHELRTPLNAIIGFSDMLAGERSRSFTPERRADYAALIRRSGEHLLEVVNAILDTARIESGAFAISTRPCALEPLARDCLDLLALKAETAGVTLSAEAARNLPEIEADPRAVTQILLNLVGNAIKFTPRGGTVSVVVAPRRGGVAISVVDSGIGIAPEHLGRLGEAFYRPVSGYAGPEHGVGLGLSVVRGLVALHGGDVAVESALGRGTTVYVFLPARRAADAAGFAAAAPEKVKACA